MRRLALFLFLASIVSAKEYRLLPPHIPAPKIIEAIPPPQTHVFAALDVNNAFTGNNTHSGTETFNGSSSFQNFIQLSGGTCTITGLQAAITAVTSAGGKVDATGCTTISTNITNATGTIIIPANVHVLLGASTWTCTITTASTPCWWLQGNNSSLIGMGMGDAVWNDQGADPTNNAATGVTNLLCSACGTTTDMVRVAIPSAARTSYVASGIIGAKVGELWINMGNSGRHAVYADSPHFCYFYSMVGYNFPGDGLLIENDIASPLNNAAAYQNDVNQVFMQPPHANTTGAAIHLAAVNGTGDITWNNLRDLRGAGNIVNGGGRYGLWMQAVSSNLHQNSVQSSYFGETVLGQANTYGVKLEASGSWNGSVNPYIADDTFHSILIEKLFGDTQGICFGANNGSIPSGTGVGGISLVGVSCSANWSTPAGAYGNIDTAHMGFTTLISGSSLRGNSGASIQSVGTTYGNNSSGLFMSHTATATANNDTLYGLRILPNYSTGANFTGIKNVGGLFDCSNDATFTPGTGTFASTWCIQIEAAQTPATSSSGGILIDNFGFGDSIRLTNGGPLAWVESSAPAVGAAATFDRCYGDSTAHALKCSYNNSAFSNVALNPPLVAGTTDLGTTALPFGNLWLGTAATNNFKFQPASTTGARIITVADPLSPTTVALPLTIASGTTTLTSNAALAAVTSQAANTTAATGVLTTDVITWSFATAPTAGDNLCHVLPYVTAGNVNFVRTNPTAAAQNVSALVINWKVVR